MGVPPGEKTVTHTNRNAKPHRGTRKRGGNMGKTINRIYPKFVVLGKPEGVKKEEERKNLQKESGPLPHTSWGGGK